MVVDEPRCDGCGEPIDLYPCPACDHEICIDCFDEHVERCLEIERDLTWPTDEGMEGSPYSLQDFVQRGALENEEY